MQLHHPAPPSCEDHLVATAYALLTCAPRPRDVVAVCQDYAAGRVTYDQWREALRALPGTHDRRAVIVRRTHYAAAEGGLEVRHADVERVATHVVSTRLDRPTSSELLSTLRVAAGVVP